MDLLVLLVSLANVDLKVPLANQDLLAFLDALETKDLKETLDSLVHPDLLECPANLDKLGHLELLENVVQLEKLVPWVLKAQLDLVANLVLLELKEQEEKEVNKGTKAQKVIEVFLVYKVFLGLWVLEETKGRWVLLVRLANLVNLDQEDLLVVMELLDHRVSWDHLVPVVAKENLVNQVPRVLLVYLDLLDLLVNQWVTMLPLWLLSLDKAKLRVPIR